MTNKATEKITVMVSPALAREIDRRAKREGLSRSEAVRLALAEWVGKPELATTRPAHRPGAKKKRDK